MGVSAFACSEKFSCNVSLLWDSKAEISWRASDQLVSPTAGNLWKKKETYEGLQNLENLKNSRQALYLVSKSILREDRSLMKIECTEQYLVGFAQA